MKNLSVLGKIGAAALIAYDWYCVLNTTVIKELTILISQVKQPMLNQVTSCYKLVILKREF